MQAIPKELFVRVVVELFTEAYEGSGQPYTWFISNEPNESMLTLLEMVSAEEASTQLSDGTSTIAAHTEHLRWSLALGNAYARGEQPQSDWEESWSVKTVNDEQWKVLKSALRAEFETLRKAIGANSDWSNEQFLTGVLALVPHAAYHLGSIRQMARIVKTKR